MKELNNDYRFDVDLEFGQIGEEYIRDIFDGDGKVEVKTERDVWKTTKNLAIEIAFKGKPSGLSTTEAKTWVHAFSYKGNIEYSLIFNVETLKKKVKKLVNENKAEIKMGGDDNQSKLILIPIKDIVRG